MVGKDRKVSMLRRTSVFAPLRSVIAWLCSILSVGSHYTSTAAVHRLEAAMKPLSLLVTDDDIKAVKQRREPSDYKLGRNNDSAAADQEQQDTGLGTDPDLESQSSSSAASLTDSMATVEEEASDSTDEEEEPPVEAQPKGVMCAADIGPATGKHSIAYPPAQVSNTAQHTMQRVHSCAASCPVHPAATSTAHSSSHTTAVRNSHLPRE